MTAVSLVLFAVLTAQGAPQGWDAPQAAVVTGRVELTPGEAQEAALAEAEQGVRMALERRGEGLLEQRKPFWFPGFAADLTFDRWLRGLDARRAIRVVDRRLDDHDHGSYKSYTASLVVEHDEDAIERALGSLRASLRSDSKLFLAKSGGTVVLWGLLGLLYLWLDRLTRGYMTWRLRGLFLGMGVVLPGIAFVMV